MKEVFVAIGKLPLKGFSKTRLAVDVGEEVALELYTAFIDDFFNNLSLNIGDIPFYFFGTPRTVEAKNFFCKIASKYMLNIKYFNQVELSFFKRLACIFQEIQRIEGECFIHLSGTDIPDFPFKNLPKKAASDDLVYLGPDDDGGYYYLGTSSKNTEIFNMDQYIVGKDSKVLDATIKMAHSIGLRTKLVENWSDIDNLFDLKKCLERSSKKVIPLTDKTCQLNDI